MNKIDFIDQKIKSLLDLPQQWDGEHAERVTDAAGAVGVFVAFFLWGKYLDLAQFFPTATGGIQIEWFVNGNEVEIEIDKHGDVYCVSVDKTGSVVFDESINISDIMMLHKVKQEIERVATS